MNGFSLGRAFWFARGFQDALPSFDQDWRSSTAQANNTSWAELVEEFKNVRLATISFFKSLPDEAWSTDRRRQRQPVHRSFAGLHHRRTRRASSERTHRADIYTTGFRRLTDICVILKNPVNLYPCFTHRFGCTLEPCGEHSLRLPPSAGPINTTAIPGDRDEKVPPV